MGESVIRYSFYIVEVVIEYSMRRDSAKLGGDLMPPIREIMAEEERRVSKIC